MALTVSIVTPTLNAAAHLRGCIESVRTQGEAGVEAEHIIVDGGSIDGSVDIGREAGCRIIQGKDSGIFDAINKGNYAAAGHLIGFLGADDRLLPSAFSALSAWYKIKKSEWVTGPVLWTGANGESLGVLRPPPPSIPVQMYASLGWSCIPHMSTYFTPAFFNAVGGFDISYRVAGDYDFFARALQIEKPDTVKRPLATFTRHGGNASMADSPRVRGEIQQIASRYASPSKYRRRTERLLLKVWLNAMNPGWAGHKLVGRLQLKRGLR